jgi:hypothetical protein
VALNASTPVGPVIYQVEVNGVVQQDFQLDVELHQEWGMHDIFLIRIEYNRAFPMQRVVPWPENAPVKIYWGRRPATLNTWYGYVNHYEMGDSDSGTKNLQFKYMCIGTSKPMNSDNGYVWGSVTPTYIAKRMAAKYSMRTVVTSTTWQLLSEVQAAESDFEFMNRIADKTGYRFWASNGTLYFIDPAAALLGASGQGIPVFNYNRRLDTQDTVRSFKVLKGDNLPGQASTVRSVFGIDQVSGQVFQATADNAPVSATVTQWNTARVADTYSEGKQIVNAWQNLSQFYIRAEAELFGNQALYPGKVVSLQGNALPDNNAGYWIVAKVVHVMKHSGISTANTSDKYMSQCVLVKNASGAIPTLTSQSVISPEFTGCTLYNDTWISNNLSVVYDGVIQ